MRKFFLRCLFFILLILFAVAPVLYKNYKSNKIRENMGKCTTFVNGTKYEKAGTAYLFDFDVDGKIYTGNFCCVASFNENLMGRKILILYEKSDPTNNFALVRESDLSEWLYIDSEWLYIDKGIFQDVFLEKIR